MRFFFKKKTYISVCAGGEAVNKISITVYNRSRIAPRRMFEISNRNIEIKVWGLICCGCGRISPAEARENLKILTFFSHTRQHKRACEGRGERQHNFHSSLYSRCVCVCVRGTSQQQSQSWVTSGLVLRGLVCKEIRQADRDTDPLARTAA